MIPYDMNTGRISLVSTHVFYSIPCMPSSILCRRMTLMTMRVMMMTMMMISMITLLVRFAIADKGSADLANAQYRLIRVCRMPLVHFVSYV